MDPRTTLLMIKMMLLMQTQICKVKSAQVVARKGKEVGLYLYPSPSTMHQVCFGDKLVKASSSLVEVEVEMHKKTSMIADELEKFGTFSEMEMFTALRKITKDPD